MAWVRILSSARCVTPVNFFNRSLISYALRERQRFCTRSVQTAFLGLKNPGNGTFKSNKRHCAKQESY